MNFHPPLGLAAAICFAAVSCYPYDHYERNKSQRGLQQRTTLPTENNQNKLPEHQQEELKQPVQENNLPPDNAAKRNAGTENRSANTSPPEPRPDYPFANKVPGKDGFVFSPYNNKVVDVRDIPSGTLVQDPTYPASEKKYFRVP